MVLSTATPLLENQTVQVFRSSGTATPGVDFTFTSPQTVTFDAGSVDGATESVSVTVIGDDLDESNETVILGLQSVSTGGSIVAPSTHTLTITNDDDPTISVNSPDPVEEGDDVVFEVTLSNPSSFTVTVDYVTTNGTPPNAATAPGDFTAVSGELVFPPGVVLRTVPVTSIDDVLFEATETFTLELDLATEATISDPIGTGTILDNDGPPGLSVLDAIADEGDGVIEFQVVLLPAAGQPVTVEWATADGSANSPTDFVADSGQVTFAPGITSQIVEVTIINDDDDGVDTTLSLVLSNPTPPLTSLVDATAVGTIVDDDNVAPTIGVMKTVDGAGADTFVFAPGETVRLTGTFTDPGSADAHSATINWGDGSPATVLPLTPLGTRAFQATHSYGASGFNSISMTVQDADGGVSGVKQVFVVIEGAAASSGHTVGLVDTAQGRWFLYDSDGNGSRTTTSAIRVTSRSWVTGTATASRRRASIASPMASCTCATPTRRVPPISDSSSATRVTSRSLATSTETAAIPCPSTDRRTRLSTSSTRWAMTGRTRCR